MKKIFVTIIALAFIFSVKAQVSVGTPDQIKHFLRTKTIVYLMDNPTSEYNDLMTEAIKKYWKITPFEFRNYSKEEFNKTRMDTNLSFLKISSVFFSNDKVKPKYSFLTLMLGGKYKLIPEMPEIASIPLAYEESEEPEFAYKVDMLVKFIQSHVEVCKGLKKVKAKKVMKMYKKNLVKMHDKTLYFIQDELSKDLNSVENIAKLYPFKIKIVSRDEARKAIESADVNVVILHKVGPGSAKMKARCYISAMNAGDGSLYFINNHMVEGGIPDSVLPKDLKKLAKK